jgi:hypothetical protein
MPIRSPLSISYRPLTYANFQTTYHHQSNSSISPDFIFIMTIPAPQTKVTLQDIRPVIPTEDLYMAIKCGLTSTPKQLPSLLLWDAEGHKLFQGVTNSRSYYGTRADQDIMVENLNQLCDMIGDDGILLELGSGYVVTLFGGHNPPHRSCLTAKYILSLKQ